MNDQGIAIIGMACVFPGAKSLDEFWRNIVNGVDSVTEIPPGRMNGADRFPVSPEHETFVACKRGGFIPSDIAFEPIRYGIMPNIIANGDPDQFLMLEVAAKALADANVADDAPARESTDVIIGRGGYLTNKYCEYYLRAEACDRMLRFLSAKQSVMSGELPELERQLRATFPPLESDSISTCMPNLVASRVANRLNLRGAAYTVDAACASSLLAVEQAIGRLRSGQNDLAVVGASHLFQIPTFWYVFSKLGALSPTSTIRPFDRRADGIVPSEGCGAIVLKRLDEARRDGDRVYAIVRGSGSSSDGRDTAILAPSSAGQVRALRRAYRNAEVDPATIGYLECHGTGTQAGDTTEIETIISFFGRRGRLPSVRGMGSIKSMIGHTMPAAGMASLIKTALALSHKILPPSLHCEEPHPKLEECPFFVVGQTRPWIHQSNTLPRRAGVSALGFGGTNAHLVLEEVPEPPPGQISVPLARPFVNHRTSASELFVFSGETRKDVSSQLSKLGQLLDDPSFDLSPAELVRSLARGYEHNHCIKAAIVCGTTTELAAALPSGKESVAGGDDCLDKNGWYFTARGDVARGKVACIFPGVGFPGLIGNYPDHLMELCLHFPEVRAAFDAIELRDRHPDDPVPTSAIFAPPANLSDEQQTLLRARIAPMRIIEDPADQISEHPAERNIASSGITVTNWISWLLLQRLEISADMLCGQSIGELSGLCAAGVLDIDEIMPQFWDALAISPAYAGKGRLAFVHANEASLAKYCEGLKTVAVAIHVAPQALVLGGIDTEIETLIERLRADHILSQALPYPPIHTPQLNYLREELASVINTDVTFELPRIPVYSAVTEDVFPQDKEGVRRTALSNLDRPVRFWQTIHKMYEEGARMFIQVGGGSLAANIKSVLEEDDVLGAAVDVDYRDPISQLNHLCATLIVAGVKFNLQRLFDRRPLRDIDWSIDKRQATKNPRLIPLRLDWSPFDTESLSASASTSNDSASNGTEVPDPDARQQAADVAPADGQQTYHATPGKNEAPSQSAQTPPPKKQLERTAERRMPFIGEVLEHEPGQRVTIQHVLDIDEDLYLRDHLFVQAQGVKPPEECLPVMPLTMILEAIAETAACVTPGLGVIGFENVKAQRWVALEDTRELPLTIQAARLPDKSDDGVTRVRAQVFSDGNSHTVATVLMSDRYRQDLQLSFQALTEPRAWPFPAESVYREGHLFHGPLFQCVSEMIEFAENGCTIALTVLSRDRLFASTQNPELITDPVVMDAIGQSMGLWAVVLGVAILPSGFEKLEFYRPSPPPGTRVVMRGQILDVDLQKRTLKSQVEAIDADGNVWFRVAGWKDWLYRYPETTRKFNCNPCAHCISAERVLNRLTMGSVCREVLRSDLQDVTLMWMERLFLTRDETEEFRRLKLPKRQWEWMLGRIAAKDARVWHARQTGNGLMLHPAAVSIMNDEKGQPLVKPTAEMPRPPKISISHSYERAVAVASDEPVGIDLALISDVSDEVMNLSCCDAELASLRRQTQHEPQNAWAARIWAAKEAAGKAMGTGLGGRPVELVALDWESDGQVLIQHEPTDERLEVATEIDDTTVIAYTSRRAAADVESSPQPLRRL